MPLPPTTVSELELDPDILVLKGAGIDGNEKVIEAVLEEAADIFSSPEFYYIEASLNMFPNVNKLIASMHKSLVHLDSPLFRHAPMGTNRPGKPEKHSLFMHR